MDLNKPDKGTQVQNTQKTKKPFDKKKWREQKYSNKAKVQKWDRIKKRQAIKQYHKELKKSGYNIKGRSSSETTKDNKSFGALRQAQREYQKIVEEKNEKRKEYERIKKERIEALKAYKEKKLMRYKKLNLKSKKGQPIMKGRIELLLEKIQKEYGNKSNE